MLRTELIIPASHCGQRLDVVLVQLMPEYSRSQLAAFLKAGKITLNHNQAKPKDKVSGGELLEISIEKLPPQKNNNYLPESIPLDIIYEDKHLIVINKPAGLVVHPAAGNWQHTLVNALLHHVRDLTDLPRAGLIHRLDKDTTGLLVCAKTLTAHTHLIRQMQAHEIQREYLALVQGHLISGGEINTFYGRHPRNRLKMAVLTQGRQAITNYSILKQYHDLTLVKVQLMTGRTHQIRVHMAYINHPVFGDPLYGGRKRFPSGANGELRELFNQFSRQALHAAKLSFTHPENRKLLTFEVNPPDDFQSVLTALDQHFDSSEC